MLSIFYKYRVHTPTTVIWLGRLRGTSLWRFFLEWTPALNIQDFYFLNTFIPRRMAVHQVLIMHWTVLAVSTITKSVFLCLMQGISLTLWISKIFSTTTGYIWHEMTFVLHSEWIYTISFNCESCKLFTWWSPHTPGLCLCCLSICGTWQTRPHWQEKRCWVHSAVRSHSAEWSWKQTQRWQSAWHLLQDTNTQVMGIKTKRKKKGTNFYFLPYVNFLKHILF